jgi:mannose-6-phosphate isomerase-like protein (cupin superfamily)
MTTHSLDLFGSALHFHPDGAVRAAARQMTTNGTGAWQIAAFHVETDADVHADRWEMHPEAEEAVCCLSGGVRVHFRPTEPETAEEVVRLSGGSAVIVTRGRWHRLELDCPSDLMSVTLRQGTRLEHRDGS